MKMVSFCSSYSLWLTRSHGPQGSFGEKKKIATSSGWGRWPSRSKSFVPSLKTIVKTNYDQKYYNVATPAHRRVVVMGICIFRTLFHIYEKIALQMISSRDMKIQKLSAGWRYSMNSGPKGHLDYADLWKGNTVPKLPPKSWHKITQQQLDDILRSARGKSEFRMPFSPFMELLYKDGDMGTAPPQQWLLYERRNQAAELRKQITGLMFELCQTFSGSDCDKILDLLVTQCHGKLQQYVDNKELMIHHTVAAAIQLDISPLTERVDPATLTEPARNIAQALLRDNADIDPSWMHDPLA